MQKDSIRTQVRTLLGKWGSWSVMLNRLRREQAAAKVWVNEDGGEQPHALLEQIDAQIAELVSIRSTMSDLVFRLSAEEQRVLLLRYESCMNWIQISMRLNYDERTVRRIETRAVDRIAGWMEAEFENHAPVS